MKVTFRDAKILTDETGVWLCLRPEEAAPCRGFVLGKKDARYDAEIKAHRDKRSLDANSYCWVLLEKLAQETDIEKEEIYRQTIKKFGPHKDFTLTQDEAKTFRIAWEKLGTGWPTEQVDFTPDGQRVVIRAYAGAIPAVCHYLQVLRRRRHRTESGRGYRQRKVLFSSRV